MKRAERNRMVTEHLPIVGYLVAEVRARGDLVSREDLASTGALALTAAADSFDPDLGVPFAAYARHRVRGALCDELRATDWATRGARRRIKATRAAEDDLARALGRAPSEQEVADLLGTTAKEVADAKADAARTVEYLDPATAESLESVSQTPEEAVLDAERDEYVRDAVAELPERMRHVVQELYFGDSTVSDLAAGLGTTTTAVSHLKTEALRLLHDGLARAYHGRHDAPAVSRSSASRLNGYLGAVAARTAGGFCRPRAAEPALAAA